MNLGFVIGCSRYASAKVGGLKYAHRDAARFGDALRKFCDVAERDLFVFSNSPDTGGDVRGTGLHVQDARRLEPSGSTIINHLVGDRKPNYRKVDTIYFFFSGHGCYLDRGEAMGGYLLTEDTILGAIGRTALGVQDVIGWLRGLRPKHVLLFLDACRAISEGGKASGTLAVDPLPPSKVPVEGIVCFAACEETQRSYESDELRHGIFTAALCEGLEETGSCRTVYELEEFVRRRLSELSMEHRKPRQDLVVRMWDSRERELVLVSPEVNEGRRGRTWVGKELRSGKVEPIQPPPQGQIFCGIDLGTSLSAASYWLSDGRRGLVPSPGGEFLIPSEVLFDDELNYRVGRVQFLDRVRNGNRWIRNVKRHLGSRTSYRLSGREYAPERVAGLILRSLRRNAEEFMGRSIDGIVAAAPANFTIAQSNALLEAFGDAGINVVRIVAEPNVASLLLGEDEMVSMIPQRRGDTLGLVVDLGGGTFDVAAVVWGDGVYEIVAAGGDNQLGGVDYDECLAEYIAAEVRRRWGRPELPTWLLDQVRHEAIRAKHELGSAQESHIHVVDEEAMGGDGKTTHLVVSRKTFAELTSDLTARVRTVCERILRDVSQSRWVSQEEVSVVLLAGQGSKVFPVKELIQQLLPQARLVQDYQDRAVAVGLGIQGAVLAGLKKDTLLLDAFSHAIGLRCADRVSKLARLSRGKGKRQAVSADPSLNTGVLWLIAEYTTIPTSESADVEVVGEGLQSWQLQIVEGISINSGNVLDVGRARLTLRPGPAHFEINLDVDANSTMILRVRNEVTNEVWPFLLNNFHLFKDMRKQQPRTDSRKSRGQITEYQLERPIPDAAVAQ